MIDIVDPENNNNALNCLNAMYVGSSGSGKTTAVKQLNISSSDCVLFFDPFGDYVGNFKGEKEIGRAHV